MQVNILQFNVWNRKNTPLLSTHVWPCIRSGYNSWLQFFKCMVAIIYCMSFSRSFTSPGLYNDVCFCSLFNIHMLFIIQYIDYPGFKYDIYTMIRKCYGQHHFFAKICSLKNGCIYIYIYMCVCVWVRVSNLMTWVGRCYKLSCICVIQKRIWKKIGGWH